jgi:hypothetical protein
MEKGTDMPSDRSSQQGNRLSRRNLLKLSTASAVALGTERAFPALASSPLIAPLSPTSMATEKGLYASLLKTWCDGLLARQVIAMANPDFHGGLLCSACGLIHGRCGDSIYPLLHMAHRTGEQKYLTAALAVYDWSERVVSRQDGGWVNDVSLSSWKGITVFRAVALAEALEHHGSVLDTKTRRQWTERLAKAAKFLDGFITIETGNVNYPVTASLAFVLCGKVLGDAHYIQRGRKLAHEVLDQISPDGFLFGEGHPLQGVSAKGCRPVDLGYNVEESLPSLGMYALLTDDQPVLARVVPAMQTHMEFMLPNGAWDNSWGTRNYKWSWWGSRTSDGCHPGLVLLAKLDPRFREVARRNAELMAQCTHDGLLYGGPDYFAHGEPACIHHTFTHAKSLATVLDRGSLNGADTPRPALPRPALPRDEAYGLKTFPIIGTHLAAIGPWRATVTDYDWDYKEDVQAGGGGAGGHVTGGALSLLFHRKLGTILVASMTEYRMIEISNQQQYREGSHLPLTPRIEFGQTETYTSLNDLKATLTAVQTADGLVFDAKGTMLTASRVPLKGSDIRYHLVYRLNQATVEMVASVSGSLPDKLPVRFVVPVASRSGERVDQPNPQTVRITKPDGVITIHTDAANGFDPVPKERTFNLVPGFECLVLAVTIPVGKEVRIRLEA